MKDFAFHRGLTAHISAVSRGFNVLQQLGRFPRASFLRTKRLEVVISNVGRNCLYISRYSLRVLDRKRSEQSALVSAELEVRLLDQVINDLPWNSPTLIGCANN